MSEERTIHDIQDGIQAKQKEITELQHKLLGGQLDKDEYNERYETLLDEIHQLEEEVKEKGF